MKKAPADPIPVVELPREHELARLAELVASAMHEPPAGLPQVKWRIRSTVRRHEEWRRRFLRASVVGALLFLAGGVVGAVVQPVLFSPGRSAAPPPADPLPSSSSAGRSRSRRQPPAPSDESPAAVSQVSAASSVALATADSTTVATLTPQAESRAAVTTPSQPVARLPSAVPARVRPPSALPVVPEARRPPEPTVSATAAIPTPGAPPAELPKSRVRHEALNDRQLSFLTPAPPAPFLGGLALPPTQATEGALPPATVSRTAPRLQKSPEVAPAVTPPDEQVLLGKALQRLRIAHDPSGALALLAQHAARFPDGALLPEAARLRTEALMLAGRKDIALAELDHQADTLPGGDERRVLRGELRATTGHWRAALADFDAVVRSLSQESAADVKARECLERALWGRASARSQLADQAGARADLVDYVRRFPSGRFAADARRLLHERR